MRRFPCPLPLAASLLLLLGGCSAVTAPVRRVTGLSGQLMLAVTIVPGANNDTPLAVDVVAVDDKKVLTELSAFTAAQWFGKRTDYLRLHPGVLKTYSWEWVPGDQTVSIRIPRTALADGILLFANYSGKGSHTAVLPQSGTVRLVCGADDFKLLAVR